jgi:hypothetical protein
MAAVAVLFVLAASVPVGDNVRPFTGTWLLSRPESTNPSEGMAPKMIVTLDEKRLLIEYVKEGEKPDVSEYKLDGGMITIKQEWSLAVGPDGQLELRSRFAAEGSRRGNMTVTIDTPPTAWKDVWQVTDGGRTLKIVRQHLEGEPTKGGEPTLIYHRAE